MRDVRPKIRRKTAENIELLRLNLQLVESRPDLWNALLTEDYGIYLEETRDELERWRQRLSEMQA